MTDLILLSPLSGWAAPLDEVPDPVFTERMLGDGLAIDPTEGRLVAPCAGHVIHVQPTRHALTLRAANGAEILIHIGLETVALGGEGFEAHVADGQAVAAGDLLISFDLDLVAPRAKSLLTPVIVTNGEAFSLSARRSGPVAVGEPLMTLTPRAGAGDNGATAVGPEVIRSFTVPLAHGVHARPAAAIAAFAKRQAAQITVTASSGRTANAKSPVALMALGIGHGDRIVISAAGKGASEALAGLSELILTGLHEVQVAASLARGAPAIGQLAPNQFRGVTASPGFAVGVAAHLTTAAVQVDPVGKGVAAETAALKAGLGQVRQALQRAVGAGSVQHRAIVEAHLAFLDDPELVDVAQRGIAGGMSAGAAWQDAVQDQVRVLSALADPRMVERVADLNDLQRQVLLALRGEAETPVELPDHAILLADDLLPSQLIGLDASKLAGLVLARGGPTSHVAILAAAMSVPAIVAAGAGALGIEAGADLILDANAGCLTVAVDKAALEEARSLAARQAGLRQAARDAAQVEARTQDGVRISVLANLGGQADAVEAVAAGAEGSGLLRTEFLFLDRDTAPSENEQLAAYRAITEALHGRPLIIRTLDVGGDKPVAYLPLPAEENPALGLRGVRVSLARPDLLHQQLRAILQLGPAANVKIMLPMVASLSELSAVRAIAAGIAAELGVALPPIGVMIETPAAAVTADLICAEADFISIGTNDLAQYALAMDRGNAALAADIDGLHPAVLRLIDQAVAGARTHGRPVSVCGGLASDLTAAPILIGLGVTELSATPAVVPDLKALIRTLSLSACEDLARRALNQTSAAAVRSLKPGDA